MKAFTNVERSGFRKGEYVGYDADGAVRVYQDKRTRVWVAEPRRDKPFTRNSLSEVDVELARRLGEGE